MRHICQINNNIHCVTINYQIYIYEGAQHAFNNDTNPGRYNKEAAELAWKRTVAFFKDKLQ